MRRDRKWMAVPLKSLQTFPCSVRAQAEPNPFGVPNDRVLRVLSNYVLHIPYTRRTHVLFTADCRREETFQQSIQHFPTPQKLRENASQCSNLFIYRLQSWVVLVVQMFLLYLFRRCKYLTYTLGRKQVLVLLCN